MKFYRLIVDAVFFVGGAAAGVYWGVNHPSQAADFAQREKVQALKVEVAADQASVNVLQKFGGNSDAAQAALTEAQNKLADAQKNLDAANQQLAQSSP